MSRLHGTRARVAATTALVATSLGAAAMLLPAAASAAASAADTPVVTGISSRWSPNLGSPTLTISGGGFTGASSVTLGGAPGSFTVVDDHTIKATFGASGPGTFEVRVTVDGQTSPDTPLAEYRRVIFPTWEGGSVPVTCTLGLESATFDARLDTFFDGRDRTLAAGASSPLGALTTDLVAPSGVPVGTAFLGELAGPVTVRSFDVDVTGATATSLDLAATSGAGAVTYPLATSVDSNPLAFGAGAFAPSSLTPTGDDDTVRLTLRGYHATVWTRDDDQLRNEPFDCVPSGASNSVLIESVTGGSPVTPTPTPVVTKTPTPTATATPSPTPSAALDLGLTGSATLKTLAKGTVPLSGSLDGHFAGAAFTGDLTLAPTTAKLVAYGLLPIVAKLQFVPQGQTTGALEGATFTSTSKVRIKLPSVTLFGLQLAGGAGCQTKSPTAITLKSGAGFQVHVGGSLSGTFAISDLTNCGGLTGLVSPLTAGGNNAIAFQATAR